MAKLKTLIFLFSFTGFAQQIKYNLYLKNQCSNEIEVSYFYSLEKDDVTYNSFDKNPLVLPEKGTYKLVAAEIGEEYEIEIDKLVNSDTLPKPSVEILLKQINASFKKSNSSIRIYNLL